MTAPAPTPAKKRKRTPTIDELRQFQRREAVIQLLVQRIPAHEMAAMLGVVKSVIDADLKAIREASHARIMTSTITDVVAGVLRDAEEHDRQAWQIFHSTEDANIRLYALAALRNNRADTVAQLQRLGAVYEEPKKIQLNAEDRAIRSIREMPPELAAEISGIRDRMTFLRRFVEIVGLDVAQQAKAGTAEEFAALLGSGEVFPAPPAPPSPEEAP